MMDSVSPAGSSSDGTTPNGRGARRRSTLTYVAVGLVIGIVIGSAAAVSTVGYWKGGTASNSSYQVAITTSFSLVGTSANVWTVSGCPGGTGYTGAVWNCQFSMTVSNGAYFSSYSVTSITTEGATLFSTTPSVPQDVSNGGSAVFEIGIMIPNSAPSTLTVTIVVGTS